MEVRAPEGSISFHDPDQSVFRAKKGLDREIVEQISEMKGEPEWMRDYRLRPTGDLPPEATTQPGVARSRTLTLTTSTTTSSQAREGRTWEDVPENIRKPLTVWEFRRPSASFWPVWGHSTTRK